jgi:hypothetical protein
MSKENKSRGTRRNEVDCLVKETKNKGKKFKNKIEK